jgi:hypothetical protein
MQLRISEFPATHRRAANAANQDSAETQAAQGDCSLLNFCSPDFNFCQRIPMIKESSTLPDAAADCFDALMHLSLLAVSAGYGDIARRAQFAIGDLLESPEAGRIVPAEYLTLRVRPVGN